MKKKLYILVAHGVFLSAGAFGQRTAPPQTVYQNNTLAQSTYKDFGMYSPHSMLNGGVLNAFNNAENTKGRRYLFDDWAKGTVVSAQEKTIRTDSFLFNFDKITNGLLVTVDKKEIIEVNKESIRSFSLSQDGQVWSFERVAGINPDKFVQVLAVKENGYALYKMINTHFVKSNYTTNGLSESGKPYDEYVDAAQFYIRLPDGKGTKQVVLKAKNIREVLGKDDPNVKDWFAGHDSDEINEPFLKGLVERLNQ